MNWNDYTKQMHSVSYRSDMIPEILAALDARRRRKQRQTTVGIVLGVLSASMGMVYGLYRVFVARRRS